jgi:hypothetical protein
VIFGPDEAIINTTFKAPPPVPIDPMEMHDWSCMLKEHLRQALIDQAQTGNSTTYKELADRLGLEPPRTIHRIVETPEIFMEDNVAAGRPMLAALCVSKIRPGIPARGFFSVARF